MMMASTARKKLVATAMAFPKTTNRKGQALLLLPLVVTHLIKYLPALHFMGRELCIHATCHDSFPALCYLDDVHNPLTAFCPPCIFPLARAHFGP